MEYIKKMKEFPDFGVIIFPVEQIKKFSTSDATVNTLLLSQNGVRFLSSKKEEALPEVKLHYIESCTNVGQTLDIEYRHKGDNITLSFKTARAEEFVNCLFSYGMASLDGLKVSQTQTPMTFESPTVDAMLVGDTRTFPYVMLS